ncbi:Pyridoxal phosphate-dependent transferase, major domain [Fusarium oxysporum f. sp. vasinfectum]|nr:Pyridoxal phosphate-dependent transferase, major domain [Fusarium oxysporum f. sp. vasinfectum]
MDDLFNFDKQQARLLRRNQPNDSITPTLPSLERLRAAGTSLPDETLSDYLSVVSQESVLEHVTKDIVPALSGQALSSRYYGFVTAVEDSALRMLISLLRLGDAEDWTGRTFPTGATASNILGLACGREAVLANKLQEASVGDLGLLAACFQAGVKGIQVLTSAGHSSLSKAASVVGLGRASVKSLRRSRDEPWRLDLDALEESLQQTGTLSIVVLSAGEVNTGRYSVSGIEEMKRVRELADRFGSWIHVDGAFGIFARAMGSEREYDLIKSRVEGVELAGSITVDGHKNLNVPYDCGMFFTKSASTFTFGLCQPQRRIPSVYIWS